MIPAAESMIAGIYDSAAGVYDSGAGIIDSGARIIDSGAEIMDSGAGIYDSIIYSGAGITAVTALPEVYSGHSRPAASQPVAQPRPIMKLNRIALHRLIPFESHRIASPMLFQKRIALHHIV